MSIGLLGKKLGMTQVYNDQGAVIPATLVQAGPCNILQIKGQEKDGYSAIQIGFEDRKKKRATKAETGHCLKAKTSAKKWVREIRDDADTEYQLGQSLTVDIFEGVEKVDVTGTSKGRGFAGVVKRWGFRGGPASHGSTKHRTLGSIGAGTDPGRVFKGKKMSGRMGGVRITVRNLDVVKIDKSRNLLVIRGAIPGPNGGYIIIRKSKYY
ncbi:MAG: 50S ribosomal protein L3 [Candidatus Scalindua sediminis]|nr:50S ribosomal protein L3 [Candidatus Scalindua sediminis]HDY67736.1 50S ribosomal protein L3 [Candidatus Scalindua sp.]